MRPGFGAGQVRLSCAAFEAFERCRRRFELAYLIRFDWPGLSQLDLPPANESSRLGKAFHRLVSDWLAGRQVGPEEVASDDPALGRLWRQFLANPPPVGAGGLVEREIVLTISGAKVVAKPDLVWRDSQGGLTILDWKTAAHPAPVELAEQSCQAKLYPYLVVEAAEALGMGVAQPDEVQMVFWFVNEPDKSLRIQHSAERHRIVGEWLRRLIEEVLAVVEYPLTADLSECARCRYQTYCHPGGVTAPAYPAEEEPEPVALEYLDYF